jgi:glutamate dehydrogenase/leucine dehydrogenase
VEADKILNEKGVIIAPDILANAGGVTVSYFEWVQNLQALSWDEDEVNQKLNRSMCKAFEEVYAIHMEHNTSLRTSAYMLALGKLVAAKQIRGIFP